MWNAAIQNLFRVPAGDCAARQVKITDNVYYEPRRRGRAWGGRYRACFAIYRAEKTTMHVYENSDPELFWELYDNYAVDSIMREERIKEAALKAAQKREYRKKVRGTAGLEE
jgi:hypothetical protein